MTKKLSFSLVLGSLLATVTLAVFDQAATEMWVVCGVFGSVNALVLFLLEKV